MIIYLICFFSSAAMFALERKVKNRYIARGVSCLGLLIPCLLAGLRDETIGTDVQVYVKQIFDAAEESSSFGEFYNKKWFAEWKYKYISEFEIGFTTVVFVVTKIFHSLSAVLTTIHMLIILPIYLGLRKFKNEQPVWLGMLIFYLMYFNESLNMMRQWIAMAIIIYAFHFLVEKRYIAYSISLITAFLFHTSAIVGFIVALIYCFVQPDCFIFIKFRNKLHVNREIKVIILFVAGFVGICALPMIINIMQLVGLGGYQGYIEGTISVLLSQIIVRIPIFILFVFNWKSMKANNYLAAFYMSMIILDLILSQLISVNMYAFRIVSYFSIYIILSGPALVNSKRKFNNRIAIIVCLVSYLLMYWLFYTVIKGVNETIPYLFG